MSNTNTHSDTLPYPFKNSPRLSKAFDYGLASFIAALILILVATFWKVNVFVGDEIISGTPEHDKIIQSQETICRVDETLCAQIKPLSFKYYLVNEEYIGERTEVSQFREGNEVEVTTDPSAFVDVALLNVQLYHRLLHLVSDFREMDRADMNNNTACLAENRVKEQTYEFALKLDSEHAVGNTPMKNHAFFASGWSNTLENCGIDI